MDNTAKNLLNWRPELRWSDVANLSRLMQEADAVARQRRHAWEVFNSIALPNRNNALWRYANASDYLPAEFDFAAKPRLAIEQDSLGEFAAQALLQPNTAVRFEVAPEAFAQGLHLLPLGKALEFAPGNVVGSGHGLFEALNLALWSAGLLVLVPDSVEVVLPIHIRIAAGEHLGNTRVKYVLGKNAKLSVVEEHNGGGLGSQVLHVSEAELGHDASFQRVLIEDWHSGTHALVTSRALLGRDAQANDTVLAINGAKVKTDIGAVLDGDGAHSRLHGVVLADGEQCFDQHTVHEHRAAHTSSTINFRTAVEDQAKSYYSGKIYIDQQAPFCQAYQENRNVLLSAQAQAHSVPELEILNDEVACSHGATLSPLQHEQIFYLQSRGLDAPTARKLVVWGFINETLSSLPAALEVVATQTLQQRLDHFGGRVP